jgi:hypothetical protein
MGQVVAAIAGPKDPYAFIEKYQAQKQLVASEGLDHNPPSVPTPNPFSLNAGGLGGMMTFMTSQVGNATVGGPEGMIMQRGSSMTVPTNHASSSDGLSELTKLAALYKDGLLSADEFETAKSELLNCI